MKTDSAGNRRAFRVTLYQGANEYRCMSARQSNCRGAVYEVEFDLEHKDSTVVTILCRAHVRELHAATADV